jgi:hypothetical protein
MLYPMVQSVVHVYIEIDKKMTKALSIVIITIIQIISTRGHTSALHPSVPTGGLTCKVQAHRVNIHIHL